jgi:hypothetical protein
MPQTHAPNSDAPPKRLQPRPAKTPPDRKAPPPTKHDLLGPAGDPAEGKRD